MRMILAAVLLCSAATAAAHVTVWPKTSAAGAREKYEVRVPNEKDVDTIAVEVRFPAGLRVNSIEQKSGWRTEPLRNAGGELIGARWTGQLSPHQFTEFGLLAINPDARELTFTASQMYADGTRVEWSGAPGSKTPAPQVTLSRE